MELLRENARRAAVLIGRALCDLDGGLRTDQADLSTRLHEDDRRWLICP
jgi:hypothetical protein